MSSEDVIVSEEIVEVTEEPEPTAEESAAVEALTCEAFFYAAFPPLYAVMRRLGRRTLEGINVGSVTIVVGLASTANHDALPFSAYDFPPARLPEFVAGVAAGLLVRRGQPVLRRRSSRRHPAIPRQTSCRRRRVLASGLASSALCGLAARCGQHSGHLTQKGVPVNASQGIPRLWIFGDHSYRSEFYG